MRRSRPTKERGERGRAAARLPRRKACLVRGLLVRVACAAPPASRLKLPLHTDDLEIDPRALERMHNFQAIFPM